VNPWHALAWNESDVPEAVSALALAAGLTGASIPLSVLRRSREPESSAASSELPPERSSDELGSEPVEEMAEALGLDAVPVELAYADLASGVPRLGPALVRIELEPPSSDRAGAPGAARRIGYLAIVRSDRRRLTVITPALGRAHIETSRLRERIAAAMSGSWGPVIDTWLEQAQVPPRRQARARDQLLGLTLAARPVDGIWLLSREPGDSFPRLLATGGCFRLAAWCLLAAALQVVLATLAWWVLGSAAFDGSLEPGGFMAWLLLAGTGIPCQVLTGWSSRRLGIELSGLLKQRLLCGALRIAPDVIRTQGSGGLLAMVSESQAVERAALDGALSGFIAVIQLAGAAVVLGLGAGGGLLLGLLAFACLSIAVLTAQLGKGLGRWTQRRFALSKLFVERVQGHRTRLVQGDPEHWHDREDVLVEEYAAVLKSVDRFAVLLGILPARGWFLLGFMGIIPAFWNGAEPAAVAVSVLGVLQAHRAFEMFGRSLEPLLAATVAWRSVQPLFQAGARPPPRALPALLPASAAQASTPGGNGGRALAATVLELRGVSYRHPSSERLAVSSCSLRLKDGERLLIQGASGSGKSTLARLMTGIHRPSSGLLLLDGLDRPTLGESQWRQRIASAPQFHENHLLSAPLSFNLLMGRNWPPTSSDLAAAQEVCRALGLESLIGNMPSGIHQVVGETGWQLSHGERSRVFLARALLQRSRVIVLDETLGALDPETLERCMLAIRQRARTLVVIAHP
jgi:ATP-binding cassette subfamily B protein